MTKSPVERVLLFSGGNDVRTTRGNRTRPYVPENALQQLSSDIEEWRALGATVWFLFCGGWDLHGAGFADAAELEAADRYETCRGEMIAVAAAAGALVLDMPQLQGIPMADDWHFSSDAKAQLEHLLLNLLLVQAKWPIFCSSTPTPSEFGDEEHGTGEAVSEKGVETSAEPRENPRLDEDRIIGRIREFMISSHRDARLPRRKQHSECTCGYACGEDWRLCCDTCWKFSGTYFKVLVNLEHEACACSVKKVPMQTIRRVVCERNPRIWKHINQLL